VELTWLGHSCFRIKGRDVTLLTDPFESSLGLSLGRQSADIVTVSHDSPHHNAAAHVSGSPRVLRGPGEYEIGGVMVSGVATAGEKLPEGKHGRNTAFAISIDEMTVCHLGDLGKTLTAEQIEALKDPDVLLIPVGGGCTLAPAEVTEVVSQLEPKLVVPMHYAQPGVSIPLESIERFCREMAIEDIRSQPKLTLTRSGVPDETTIVILEPAAAAARR
jgi:L-ascorbate metabolism protein UlaG (beta-lactamase superfamily)